MVICESCSGIARRDDVFCLHCGNLLRNYEDVIFSNVDYTLTGDDFLLQIAYEFQKSSGEFDDIMNDFGDSFDSYLKNMDDVNEKLTECGGDYEGCAEDFIEIFDGLRMLFDNLIVELNDVTLRNLNISTIFWRESANFSKFKKAYEKHQDVLVESLSDFIVGAKDSKANFESMEIGPYNPGYEKSKEDMLISYANLITFHESLLHELKFIKDKYS